MQYLLLYAANIALSLIGCTDRFATITSKLVNSFKEPDQNTRVVLFIARLALYAVCDIFD